MYDERERLDTLSLNRHGPNAGPSAANGSHERGGRVFDPHLPEASREAAKVAHVAAVRRNVPTRLHKAAHTPVLLHHVAHRTRGCEVVGVEGPHEATAQRSCQPRGPHTEPRQAVSGIRRHGAAADAALAHQRRRLMLRDDEWHALFAGHALVRADASDLWQDTRCAAAAATATAARLYFEQPAALAAAEWAAVTLGGRLRRCLIGRGTPLQVARERVLTRRICSSTARIAERLDAVTLLFRLTQFLLLCIVAGFGLPCGSLATAHIARWRQIHLTRVATCGNLWKICGCRLYQSWRTTPCHSST